MNLKLHKNILKYVVCLFLVIPFISAIDISTCSELQNMSNDLSGNYDLTNNIDCSDTINWNSGEGFIPIGNTTNAFIGIFDGNDYTISSLYINRTGNYQGLFGNSTGQILDTNLINAEIYSGAYSGILVGYNNNYIEKCSAIGNIMGNGNAIGGLVGYNNKNIKNSYSNVLTNGTTNYVGGLVGYNSQNGFIYNSNAVGNVYCSGSYCGGLAGWSTNDIVNCSAEGNVVGNTAIGGLVGNSGTSSMINNSYAIGDVIGVDKVGGLAGYLIGITMNSYSIGSVIGTTSTGGLIGGSVGSVINSFWDNETSGQITSGGGVGKTTAEMKNITTFSDAGWLISTSNNNQNNGYPFLDNGNWLIYEKSGNGILGISKIWNWDKLNNETTEKKSLITGEIISNTKQFIQNNLLIIFIFIIILFIVGIVSLSGKKRRRR